MKIAVRHFWRNRLAYREFFFMAVITFLICSVSILFIVATATHNSSYATSSFIYAIPVLVSVIMCRLSLQKYRKASCEVGSLSEMRLYCRLTPRQLNEEIISLTEQKLAYQRQLKGYEEELKALEAAVQQIRSEQSELDAKVTALKDKFCIVRLAYADHDFDKKILLCQNAIEMMS